MGEKRMKKDNIPRVKALITTLSLTKEIRSGFSLKNASDNDSLHCPKAHIITSHRKTIEEILYKILK